MMMGDFGVRQLGDLSSKNELLCFDFVRFLSKTPEFLRRKEISVSNAFLLKKVATMDEFATEYLRAILLLGIATALWVIYKLKHKQAEVSLRWLGGLLESYAITAGFWTGVVGIAVVAVYFSLPWILHLVLLILFTKAFEAVTFIEVSSIVMSIIWGMAKQSKNSRLDYRIHVMVAILIVAVILMFFYLSKGLPVTPATFP